MSKARVGANARAAVMKLFNGRTSLTDVFLASLWLEGFKVVPLGAADLMVIEQDRAKR